MFFVSYSMLEDLIFLLGEPWGPDPSGTLLSGGHRSRSISKAQLKTLNAEQVLLLISFGSSGTIYLITDLLRCLKEEVVGKKRQAGQQTTG